MPKITRPGPCIGSPSRCRGGLCSCCDVCLDFRWNHDGSQCLSTTCSPITLRPTGRSKSRSKPKEKVVLPAWLRTKPRSVRGKREAAIYARSKGIDLPWEGWEKWEGE